MRIKVESIFAFGILPLTLPLAYFEIWGARVLPLLVVIGYLIVSAPVGRLKFTYESCFYLALLIYSFLIGLLSSSLSIAFAILIFYWLAYWPLHVRANYFGSVPARSYVKAFIFFSAACAVGVIAQFVLAEYFLFYFGKIDFEGGGRVAYGFIWSDYSFLSLFLASVVPLVWFSQGRMFMRIVLSGLFILASVITSARTGLVSLALAFSIVFLIDLLRAALRGRIRKSWFISLPIILFVLPFFIAGLAAISPRIISLSGSERVEGFLSAFSFLEDNPIFGAAFDISYYKDNVDVIPHNMILYVLAMGGVVFLLFFLIWFFRLSLRISALGERGLVVSFYTSVIGFQFVPSFYSAYYFAVLISICSVFSIKSSSRIVGCEGAGHAA